MESQMDYQQRIAMLERNREQCQADKAAKRITKEQYRIRHRDVCNRIKELQAERFHRNAENRRLRKELGQD